MGGYVGKLFSSMFFESEEKGEADNVSPYVCSQAYGRIHAGYDGREQQDSAQFLEGMLTRLNQEERAVTQLTTDEKSTVESAFEGEECQAVSIEPHVKGTDD